MCATSRKTRQAAVAEVGEGHRSGSKLVLLLVGKQAKPLLMGGEPQISAHLCDKKKEPCRETHTQPFGADILM